MERYIEDDVVNFQVNAICSMLLRGLSDIEIAASLNQSKEENLNNPEKGWSAKDVRTIISDFKLDKPKHKNSGGVLKYKLVNTLDLDDIFLQLLVWVCIIIVTLGLAFPFYVYYFIRRIVNSTELHEIK